MASYFQQYTGQIRGALGPHYGKSFRYLLLDSYEAGMENWTDDMIAQFRTRRGYDPTRYLPVLTGRVVGGADSSDKFLWDFRRTIADLLSDNHYGVATERAEGAGPRPLRRGDGRRVPDERRRAAGEGTRRRSRWASSGRRRPARTTSRRT